LGNAYFSRVIHVVPRGFRRLLVISSAFHTPRVEAVFRWVYSLDSSAFDLEFESVPDVGIEADALRARIEKEQTSLGIFEELRGRIETLDALHEYLFSEHGVYRADRVPVEAAVDPATY
jgi:hypothetical protein